MRKLVLALAAMLSGIVATAATGDASVFPPRPAWQPDSAISNNQVLERMVYYLDDRADLVVFEHGTAVILPARLTDKDARTFMFMDAADPKIAILYRHEKPDP